jgi:hypothetical protein
MYMKKIHIALVALAMAAVPAGAHVFDDAVFYFNGGKDANGDGYFNTGELRNIVDANASNTARPTIANFHRMTNEVVHCPYSGKTFTSGCLNFPQEITHTYTTNIVGDVTNVTVEARGRVSKVYIDNVFKDVIGNCSNYSAVVRFRRDAVPKIANDFQDWMLRIGYDWSNGGRGLAIGFNGSPMTNRYFTIMAGQQYLNKNDVRWKSTTETNAWTDLAVAVDGWKVKIWYMQENDNQLRSAEKTFSYNSSTLSQLAAQSNWQIQLGSEQDVSSTSTVIYAMTNGVKKSSSNAYKCWAGSIQQLAFWTRTLTDADVRQAFGGTAPVELQVGLANGASTEFRGETSAAGTGNWEELSPSLAAGGSLSLTYTNDFAIMVPQVLTLIPTPASASGALRVKVNGSLVKSVAVMPGHTNLVPVASTFFRPGANTITLERTDAGASPLVLDAFSLGGSWVAGRSSSANDVFPAEHAQYDSVGTWYAGSTWHKLWRGVTSSLSITINFPVEKRLLDRGYTFRYRHRIVRAGQRHMDFILNGESIYSGIPPGGVNVYNLPSDKLVDGMNTLQLKPTNGGSDFSCFAFHLVEFEAPPEGTMVIIR